MLLKELTLIHFRNYHQKRIEFAFGVNLFSGPNGSGKTNLMEAISLLLSGTSLKSAGVSEMIHDQHSYSLVKGVVTDGEIDYEYQVTLERNQNKKSHLKNGKPISSLALASANPIVVFIPDHLHAIKSGSESRRDLTDQALLAFEPKARRLMADYKKILAQRNKILRNHVDGVQTQHQTDLLLKAIDPVFINLSTQVALQRINYLQQLEQVTRYVLTHFFGVDCYFQIHYLISRTVMSGTSSESESRIYQMILSRRQELREAEYRLGYSLIGAHRHEIEFFFQGKNAKTHCSQGQQRLIILAFKMAQMIYYHQERGIMPMLILDDVLSELDQTKQGIFLDFLKNLKSQIFMTSTQAPESFKGTTQYV